MDGGQFLRKVRRLGRKHDVAVRVEPARGKGSHQLLYYGAARTTVKKGEIGKGLLHRMCGELGIDPGDL